MISLGREPQGMGRQIEKSPGGATDFRLRRKPQPSSPGICRRSAADGHLGRPESWGSRPRLCICRRSAAQGTRLLGSCLELLRRCLPRSRGWGADYILLFSTIAPVSHTICGVSESQNHNILWCFVNNQLLPEKRGRKRRKYLTPQPLTCSP